MPIYDRPTKELMRDFANSELEPGQEFRKPQAQEWFAKHYPRINPSTVSMHVEGMSVNSPQREHHPNIHANSNHDLFFKIERGRFRLWNRDHDPAPLYCDDFRQAHKLPAQGQLDADDDMEELVDGDAANLSREFAYERDLQNYLAQNLHAIEPGLNLYEDEGLTGIEYPAGNRRIDILAVDKSENLVVIELKVSRGYDRVIGQLLRYMGWVNENLADEKKVRGIIVASDITDDLKMAVSLVNDVKLVEYQISFSLNSVN